ncbi:uncharacterized protein [Apostichopus japonicus]|uniref:uncharacterized protein n=1 Tax=Stichopus japonicus TaxID=307972 RepID=UPI003AB3557F
MSMVSRALAIIVSANRDSQMNKLNKTEERLAKNPLKDDDSTDDDNDDVEPVCKKRTLRSNVAGPSSSGRPHILPVSCIICHADHWIWGKVTCKRRREPLTRYETIDAGKLRKAAELTCNESLLLQMRGRDLVEVPRQDTLRVVFATQPDFSLGSGQKKQQIFYMQRLMQSFATMSLMNRFLNNRVRSG